MTDLRDLLELATDRVEPTGGAAGALTTARRRRRTRRGLAASAAVVVVVAGVALAGVLGQDSSDEPMPAPSPTPPPTRTAEPDPVTFDPSLVDDLPPAPAGLAPVLPEVLDVPTSATPALADDPVEAAVLTFARSDALKVLGVDGGWRHVPLPVEGGRVELSDDGTRLLVETAAGVDVWDVTTGAVRSRADRGSLWDESRGGGMDVEVGWSDADDALAVTSGDRSLLVRDDSRATYANGGLSVQAVLDDGTVLLRVLVDPGPAASVRFVAWEPRSGELWWVMHVPDVTPGWSMAAGVLG